MALQSRGLRLPIPTLRASFSSSIQTLSLHSSSSSSTSIRPPTFTRSPTSYPSFIKCSQIPLQKNTKLFIQGFSSKSKSNKNTKNENSSSSVESKGAEDVDVDVDAWKKIPLSRIRNFCIIAHVDHGKSTLADRLLELTGNIATDLRGNQQVLDTLQVEKERGITVKAQTASMITRSRGDGATYLLNLIDTPGHVDFNLEVKRSLRACQAALLLVDSTQGIQAQTFANYNSAKECGLTVIPCITKLDLPHSDPAMALQQIHATLGFKEDEVIWTSAKTGEGVAELLEAVIQRTPPPEVTQEITSNDDEKDRDKGYLGYIVDSWYDQYKGVVCLVAMRAGEMAIGDQLSTTSSIASSGGKGASSYEVQELGILLPQPLKQTSLSAGQVGYMIAGVKSGREARVGDLISNSKVLLAEQQQSELSVAESKPMLFASVYPYESNELEELRRALDRLLLNDASVTVQVESSAAMGQGFRCGFLGKLHMEVFFQRLQDEHGTQVVATAPSVPYIAVKTDGERVVVEKASALPDKHADNVDHYMEQVAMVVIVTPPEYLGSLMEVLMNKRGVQEDFNHIDENRVMLKYRVPWEEVVIDLHDLVKKVSSGYASFDYEPSEPIPADVVRVDIVLNGKTVDALSFVANRATAEQRGRKVAEKLRKVIKRQQFEVVIQAAIGKRVVAKARIPPVRKDVLSKSGKLVGGGDSTRKQKLLKKQKEGKKRLKMIGNVQVSTKAFLSVLER